MISLLCSEDPNLVTFGQARVFATYWKSVPNQFANGWRHYFDSKFLTSRHLEGPTLGFLACKQHYPNPAKNNSHGAKADSPSRISHLKWWTTNRQAASGSDDKNEDSNDNNSKGRAVY